MTYLTRRYAGVFYARIRVTTCSGRRTLLRFSLGTRDRLEARRHLLAYLSWLPPDADRRRTPDNSSTTS